MRAKLGFTLLACMLAYVGLTPTMAAESHVVRLALQDASGQLMPGGSLDYVVDGVKNKAPALSPGTWLIKTTAPEVDLYYRDVAGMAKATLVLPAEPEVWAVITLTDAGIDATIVHRENWPVAAVSGDSTAALKPLPYPHELGPAGMTSAAQSPYPVFDSPSLSAWDRPLSPRPVYAPVFQGGDDCSSAVTIGPALPISVSGTTVGYTDDYDEVCPYTGSTSPDVVYSFTPAADVAVTMTLCEGMTDYDTKMYIYAGTCPDTGNPFACNDDACVSAAGTNYVSELAGLVLTGGTTYYIVIDGYGDNSGNYYLDITESEPPPPAPECPPETLNNPPVGQPVHAPDDPWTAGVSDEDFPFMRFDNFSGLSGNIVDIHWWGLEADAALGNCTRDPNNFEVIFYADAGGSPGAVVASYILTPTRTDTGLVYHSTYQLILYEYSAILSPGVVLTDGWVSIQGIDAVGCRFWHMSGSDGDGVSCGDDGAGIVCGAPDFDFDLSLCLTGEYIDLYGACCVDEGPACEDCVLMSECTDRYAVETLCEDMWPPCGEGACCNALTGECEVTTPADCPAPDYLFMGYGVDCGPDVCPCVVPCPPGGTAEGEACGDDTNGGCNMTTPTFEPVALDQTMCGTAWASGSTRDTDWYELVLTESMILTLNGEGEFMGLDVIMGFIETVPIGSNDCADSTGYINPYAVGAECEELTVVTECIPAGTYWPFVAAYPYDGLPCGTENDYVFTITGEPCYIPVGACCISTGECIPDQTEDQCMGMDGQWQGDGTGCDPNPCTPWYCDSGATSTYDSICEEVDLNTIANNTAGICATYSDFTVISTDLVAGGTYPLSVVVGTCGGCYSKWAKVFIDWNQDIDFDDPGEQAWTSGASSSTCPQTFSGTITVPVTATLGATRMRVVVREGGSETTTLPCGTFTWGETEDYTVNILAAPEYGACCDGMTCYPDMTEADCTGAGWVYMGDGSTCAPINPCVGACCFTDGSCTEVADDATCTGLGGTFQGSGTDCDPNLCPQPGDDCGNPVVLTGPLPIVDNNTTCGHGEAYEDTCLGSYDGGDDIIYEITLPAGYVKISMDPLGTTYTGFTLDDSCPPDPTTCLITATNSGSSPYGALCTYLDAGTYYIMVDTWPSPQCIPEYNLTIEECEPCVVDCTPNEGEVDCYPDYDDTYNAGCNATTPVFQPINCGDSICGNTGVFPFGTSTYRDMDWFEFDITVDSYVTWALNEAEVPIAMWILQPGPGGCDAPVTLEFANIYDVCVPLTLTSDCLAAGTYWLIISTPDWEDYPCGSMYDATLTCEPCTIPTGACCDTGACTPDVYEADCLTGPWYEGVGCDPNPCPQPTDCSNPATLSGVPSSALNQATCGTANNYADTCMGYYDGGEDMMYELVVGTDSYAMVTLDPKGTTWSGFAVATDCPPMDCIAVVGDSTGTSKSSACLPLAAGTYYIMVDTWPSPDCIPDFDLFVDTCTPPIGACCYNDGADCVDTDPLDCIGTYAGDWYSGEECATFDCPTPCDEDTITIEMFTDSYGSETSAELIEQGSGTIMWSVGTSTLSSNTFYSWDVCVLSAGCYDFYAYDSYGDGGADWETFLNGASHASGTISGYGGYADTLGGGCTPLTVDPSEPWDDEDGDFVPNVCDNCPLVDNPDQENSDGDSFGDACDNCPYVDNETQANSDGDSHGDACDNCPTVDNENQQNTDGDSHGNACDNCPGVTNEDQANADGDSHGNACDNCPYVDNEDQANGDGDSYGNACDNCPDDWNENQADADSDNVGDVCDNCVNTPNPAQTNSDVTNDPPGDSLGDACDNCPVHANEDQADMDGDSDPATWCYPDDTGSGHGGDVCDVCPEDTCHRDLNHNGVMDCAEPDFIPTVSAWGLLALALLLLVGAKVYFRRRTA